MIVGSVYGALSPLIGLATAAVFFLIFAAVGVGIVSAIVHDRAPPESLRDRAFWVCRGVAYITLAGAGAIGALWGLVAVPVITIILLGVFFFGLVGWRMRGRIR